jgi:single-strand DNA-binding protein
MYLNQVNLIGYVGKDAEVTSFGGIKFSLGTTKNWKDKDGNWHAKVQWHNVLFGEKDSERVKQYAKKGSRVFVTGSIEYNTYTDRSGIEKSSVTIKANYINPMDKLPKESDKPGNNNGNTTSSTAAVADVKQPDFDDDVPW